MKIRLLFLTAFTLLLSSQGCGKTIMGFFSGPLRDLPSPDEKVVIGGNHKGAVAQARIMLQKMKLRVVEQS